MADSCTPKKSFKVYDFRIYSILIPLVLMLLVLESIYVFMVVPSSKLGTAESIIGALKSGPIQKLLTKT